MQDGLFFGILVDKLRAYRSEIDVTKEADYWIVKSNGVNILMDYSPVLKFRGLKWWESVDYFSTSFVRVRLRFVSNTRLIIQVDHKKLSITGEVDTVESIAEVCFQYLMKAIGQPNDGLEP